MENINPICWLMIYYTLYLIALGIWYIVLVPRTLLFYWEPGKNNFFLKFNYSFSGCGKTRTIFEYLSKYFGFYFTFKGPREDQYIPGSSEFEFFLQRVQNRLKDYPLTNPANTVDENQEYVDRFIQCIFVARLYLFEYLHSKLGGRLTPELWLYVQLFPERIGPVDLFSILSKRLRHLNQGDLNSWLQSLLNSFPEDYLSAFLV